MKMALPCAVRASMASAPPPVALRQATAKGITVTGALPGCHSGCTRPWSSSGQSSLGSAPLASSAASAIDGQRCPWASCHSGMLRRRPSLSSGVVSTPTRGGCSDEGHNVADGSCITDQRSAAPALALLSLACAPAAPSTTGAPGATRARANAASPGRASTNCRSSAMTRACSARRCWMSTAWVLRAKGQGPSSLRSVASDSSSMSMTRTFCGAACGACSRSSRSVQGRDNSACSGLKHSSSPTAAAPKATPARCNQPGLVPEVLLTAISQQQQQNRRHQQPPQR